MSSPDLIAPDHDRCGQAVAPVNPFVSNLYHFGMLLGVADLEIEQGYHRGKSWLHNAWLHGEGVVWGLAVELRAEHNEIAVSPGLAIDRHGREMRVEQTMCVDLGAWFAERRPDDLEIGDADGDTTFVVHVELAHDSCFDRPVPSISQPCEDASFDTAYSRAVERGLPRLSVPNDPPPVKYPRLRQYFGQAPVTDPLVVEARDAVDAASDSDRAVVCLDGFRRLAAADVIDLAPEEGAPPWSPSAGDGAIVLAEVHARLRPDGDGFVVVPDGDGVEGTTVDNLVRPSHVRTRTIQELLCHGHGPGAGPVAPPSEDDADTPPQVVASSVVLDGATVRLGFTRPLDTTTVTPDSFTVTVLRADGWHAAQVRQATVDDDGTVNVVLTGAPRSRPVRVVAVGTGPTPILSSTGKVLAGVDTDPVVRSGADAVVMITAAAEED